MAAVGTRNADLRLLIAFVQDLVDARKAGTHIDANGLHRHLRHFDAHWLDNQTDLVRAFTPRDEPRGF